MFDAVLRPEFLRTDRKSILGPSIWYLWGQSGTETGFAPGSSFSRFRYHSTKFPPPVFFLKLLLSEKKNLAKLENFRQINVLPEAAITVGKNASIFCSIQKR